MKKFFSVLFWTFLGFLCAIIGFFGLIFYMHLYPFGHDKFNKEEWIAEGKKGSNAERCAMAGTVIDKIVSAGMHRSYVEERIGIGYKSKWKPKDGTSIYDYTLGWCSPIAWDPYGMRIYYDRNDIVTAVTGHQY